MTDITKAPPDPSDKESPATRRDLKQIASAVILIDAMAIGLGALAARFLGSGGYWIGLALAA